MYEWEAEPDYKVWKDEETGFFCTISRSDFSGSLCGYVGVPIDDRISMTDYHTIEHGLDVHGGITFCEPRLPPHGPVNYMFYGFDCSHYNDFCPAYHPVYELENLQYRNIEYVTNEITSLARQLKEITDGLLSGDVE